ncbi:acetyltransferase [Myxococcus stipitatus DSM 14675]|uniref:Acetyltransferase n=1 Tax=Myxococcus stipitatus (strain DSM 14675 / JCM 12634 / Mx s8) TaxID=1278073 RepID=L7UHZ7_MYXSD|nr:GNAT family N-acetyltransferase [Myxococcus stipitatus]AGC48596.1 acetyltransferase [Myxococcus stipitatus DSM 14675]
MTHRIQGLEHLTTDRLLLRAFHENDVDEVFTLHSDEEGNRFLPSAQLKSKDAARELLALWLSDWADHGVGYWMVERREQPGVAVGVGGFRHKQLEGRTVLNLAYRLSPHVHGSGYATEIARMALEMARQHLPEVPLVAIIHPENTASIRVVERLGMKLEREISLEGETNRLYVVG